MPEWIQELDEATIRSIAKKHLSPELPDALDDSRLVVRFFAEGAFNKLYLISYANYHTEYLLRVTLPVEPYFKTESEVATLAFLGANTSIPVARVVAWDSNADNELGFEWLLMERVRGVTLQSVWREMSWQAKHVLTADLAGMIKLLRDIKFDRVGSLYFESALMKGSGKPNKRGYGEEDSSSETCDNQGAQSIEASTRPITGFLSKTLEIDDSTPGQKNQVEATVASEKAKHDKEEDSHKKAISRTPSVGILRRARPPKRIDYKNLENFTVGPLFDRIFFMDDRVYLPGDRGPYENSQGMLKAEVEMQLEWVKNGRLIMRSKKMLDEAGYCEDDFEQEAPIMEDLCHAFLDILPKIYQNEEFEKGFILQHHDLNASNILVDPTSDKITGIVDWEMTCLVPRWMASAHPVFLQDIDLFTGDETEPPLPSYEHEHDDDIDGDEETAIMKRDRWESKHLRDHFDNTMKALAADDHISAADDDWGAEMKRNFRLFVWEITENIAWSARWLEDYHAGIGGLEGRRRQTISDADIEKLIAERAALQDGAVEKHERIVLDAN